MRLHKRVCPQIRTFSLSQSTKCNYQPVPAVRQEIPIATGGEFRFPTTSPVRQEIPTAAGEFRAPRVPEMDQPDRRLPLQGRRRHDSYDAPNDDFGLSLGGQGWAGRPSPS